MKAKSRRRKTPGDLKGLKALFQVVEKGKTMWETTFDAIRDPVMIINQDYRMERVNWAASEKAGYPIQEMVEKRCYELFAGRNEPCPRCPLKATLSSGKPHAVEIEKLNKSLDFQVNSYPLSLADSSLVVHHYRNVTDEKTLQRKLVQSEKMAAIGMLSGGIAHEINNPLGGILAFTQLLQSELPPESSAQEDLKEIEAAASRCKKIVADLLQFARPSTGMEKQPEDVNGLIEKILPLLRLNLRSSQVTLKTEFGASLKKVLGEATQLQQVFLNLIQNAAESMKEGGEVLVRTGMDSRGQEVFVDVQDRGSGIPKERLAHIFDPFYTTKNLGTGLGLAICDSIIQDHRGRIEVKSQEGRGTTFRVVLRSEAVEAETTDDLYGAIPAHR